MLETAKKAYFFVEMVMFVCMYVFNYLWWIESLKELHLFEKKIKLSSPAL